jgi:hypothetical protein
MNRAVPPGDCGNRNRAKEWQSRFAGTLSCAIGLVRGVETNPERVMPLILGSMQDNP